MRELLADLLNRLEQRCIDLDNEPDLIPGVLNTESGRQILSFALLKQIYQEVIKYLRDMDENHKAFIDNLSPDICYRINKTSYFSDYTRTTHCTLESSESAKSIFELLPRSVVIMRDRKTLELKLCVMTLSKNFNGYKDLDNPVLRASGVSKVYKQIYRIDRVSPEKSNSVARLSINLGNNFKVAKEKYALIKDEIALMRRFKDFKYIAQPVLGSMFKKFSNTLHPYWKAYILDEDGVCLHELNLGLYRHLYKGISLEGSKLVVKYTNDELSVIENQIKNNLTPEIFHTLMGNMLQAVKALHSAEVVHGDIKAENIILYRDSNAQLVAKLADFGAAIEVSRRRKDLRLLLAILGYNKLELKNNEFFAPENASAVLHYILQRSPFVCPIFDSENEKLEHFRGIGKQFLQNIVSKSNQITVQISHQEPPIERDVNHRIRLYLKHLSSQNRQESCEVKVNKLLTTPAYAPPEVFSSHARGPIREQFFFDNRKEKFYGRDMLFAIRNRQAAITEDDLPIYPDYKNDIFALGITFFVLLYNQLPLLDDRLDQDRIKYNPLLAGMLALDPRDRFDIDQAIQVWQGCVNQALINEISASTSSSSSSNNSVSKRLKIV